MSDKFDFEDDMEARKSVLQEIIKMMDEQEKKALSENGISNKNDVDASSGWSGKDGAELADDDETENFKKNKGGPLGAISGGGSSFKLGSDIGDK